MKYKEKKFRFKYGVIKKSIYFSFSFIQIIYVYIHIDICNTLRNRLY